MDWILKINIEIKKNKKKINESEFEFHMTFFMWDLILETKILMGNEHKNTFHTFIM